MKKHYRIFAIAITVIAALIIIFHFAPIDNRTEYMCSTNPAPVSYTFRWFSGNDVNKWDNLLSHTGPKHPGCEQPAHIKLYLL